MKKKTPKGIKPQLNTTYMNIRLTEGGETFSQED